MAVKRVRDCFLITIQAKDEDAVLVNSSPTPRRTESIIGCGLISRVTDSV